MSSDTWTLEDERGYIERIKQPYLEPVGVRPEYQGVRARCTPLADLRAGERIRLYLNGLQHAHQWDAAERAQLRAWALA